MMAQSGVATSADNPSNLPSRYEIRRLTEEHREWANALVSYANIFHSPIWSLCLPEHKAKRVFSCMAAAAYFVDHQISSGMSFGVFDTEYKFKRPESEATGGALYWDELKDSPDATSEEMLARIDFPLASVALAYDGINQFDAAKLADISNLLPFGAITHLLDSRDPRGDSWKPKEPGQVLLRNGTATRHDYEGEHLMGNLARFLMREAKLRGYKAIQTETSHDAVHYVWSHPPLPFKAEVISKGNAETCNQDGKMIYAPSKQAVTKIYVTL